MNQKLVRLCNDISYLPAAEHPLSAAEHPLSADVVLIQEPDYVCIFDVGSSGEARLAIESVPGKKLVVLSHFHPDHTANLSRITFDRLYGGRETIRRVGAGECVNGPVRPALPEWPDSDARTEPSAGHLPLSILPVPSSHAKGCLLLCAGTKIAFCGDALYAGVKNGRLVYNAGQLKAMLELLEGLEVKMLALSHDRKFVYPKETVLDGLRRLYARRDSRSSYIDAE